MADDDDWETDADFENNLTEAEQRAFGNKETMDKYNTVMDKAAGGAVPGEAKMAQSMAPTAAQQAAPSSNVITDITDTGLSAPASTPVFTPMTPAPAPAPPAPTPTVRTPTPGKLQAPAPPPPAPTPTVRTPTPGKLQMPAVCGEASTPAATTPLAGAPSPLNRAASSQGSGNLGSARGAVHNRHRCASTSGDAKMKQLFDSFDTNRDGSIDKAELSQAMERLGMAVTADKLAAMVAELDLDQSGAIGFAEFSRVVERIKTSSAPAGATMFEKVVTGQRGAVMQHKHDTSVHSFAQDECAALVAFINSQCAGDASLSYLLPIQEITELFSACVDGVLLCRLINIAAPETVDERVVNLAPANRFLITENLNLALNAAKSLGLKVVNIGSQDIIERRPHLVLGLVWQLVKLALLSKINLKENPNLIRLLHEDETLEMLRKLPPEKLLLRWFNYHLERAGVARRIANYGNDLADSELYLHLMSQIDPERLAKASVIATTPDKLQRAKVVVGHGQRMGAEFTVQPSDIVAANEKLNLGFVAALFNACPGLEPPDEEASKLLDDLPEENEGDSREERAFRMWMNSLGIDDHVANLFDDVREGNCLLQTMDHVRPGVVEWGKVNKPPFKMVFKKLENLNYAVSLGRGPFHFSLVGVDGKDLVDGNKKLTLALVWQLMRCHLLAFLASLRQHGSGSDDELIKWANERAAAAGQKPIRDFSDKSLSSGLYLIELLAAVEPRAVDRALVTPGSTDDEKKLNAKYAISSVRKLPGAALFCTWEDLVDVRPKMILSFVATLMSVSFAAAKSTPPRAAAES